MTRGTMGHILLVLLFSMFANHLRAFQPPAGQLAAADTFHLPAEWENHEAVWVGWEMFAPFQQPSLSVVKALLPYVPVHVVTESKFSAQVAREYLHLQGADSSKPTFHVVNDNRLWLRDHGPVFLVDRSQKKLGFADFVWSHYGIRDWLKWLNPDIADLEKTFRSVAKKTGSIDSILGTAQGAKRFETDISIEGGSLEVNGKGVLILCEEVTFQRNPGKSRLYIESEFRRVLGVSKIIWMKQGLADDPHIIRPITGNYIGFGTGGHTDEFVRFVNDSTLLLAWVEESEKDLHPIHRMNYERMNENLKILESETDQNGRPFHIIKVPLPNLLYKKVAVTNFQKHESDDAILSSWIRPTGFKQGDSVYRVAAASYLNYFVTNGVVLLPQYSKQGSSVGKEEQVRRIIEAVFPDRKLIFIDVMNLNYEGGGIHCITQQQPATR